MFSKSTENNKSRDVTLELLKEIELCKNIGMTNNTNTEVNYRAEDLKTLNELIISEIVDKIIDCKNKIRYFEGLKIEVTTSDMLDVVKNQHLCECNSSISKYSKFLYAFTKEVIEIGKAKNMNLIETCEFDINYFEMLKSKYVALNLTVDGYTKMFLEDCDTKIKECKERIIMLRSSCN